MSFFNDLGKKISQTSQGAVNKTRAMTETSKINGVINDSKRKIELAYKEIGSFYFEKYGNNPDPEIAEKVSMVKELNDKINQLQIEVRRINGFATCPNCGQIIKEGFLFCTNCGMKFEQPKPRQEEKVCKSCGYPVMEGTAFCTRCGTPINAGEKEKAVEEYIPQLQNQGYYPQENISNFQDSIYGDVEKTVVMPGDYQKHNYETSREANMPESEEERTTGSLGNIEDTKVPEAKAEPLKSETDEDVKLCPSCGYECKKEALFCLRCGEKLEK